MRGFNCEGANKASYKCNGFTIYIVIFIVAIQFINLKSKYGFIILKGEINRMVK